MLDVDQANRLMRSSYRGGPIASATSPKCASGFIFLPSHCLMTRLRAADASPPFRRYSTTVWKLATFECRGHRR